MSKLEELIKEFCPNGVEYVKIGSVVNYEQPSKYLVKKADYKEEYSTPVLTAGQTFILGYTNEMNGIYNASKDSPVIIFDDFTGAFKWVDFPFKVKSSAIKFLKANEKRAMLRYVFHVMGNINLTSTEHKRLWIGIYSELQIPLPALPVQREIVRILDSFTLYSAELTAELTARRKQYEFYRDKLLNFESNTKLKKFGDVATIVRGASPRPIQMFLTDSSEGVNCIKIGDGEVGSKYITKTKEKITKEGANKSRYVKRGDFILSNSMSFGRPYILKIDGCIHDGWLAISDYEKYFISDFLYYLLNSSSIQRTMAQKASFGGAVQNLNADIVRGIELPIPPMEVQERIVKVLDNFDAICSDLGIGLPAEIEKRQKQYEYYREKLLTFDGKYATILTERNGTERNGQG